MIFVAPLAKNARDIHAALGKGIKHGGVNLVTIFTNARTYCRDNIIGITTEFVYPLFNRCPAYHTDRSAPTCVGGRANALYGVAKQ